MKLTPSLANQASPSDLLLSPWVCSKMVEGDGCLIVEDDEKVVIVCFDK